MKLNLYAIKDTVVGEFQNVIESQNDGVIIRDVTNAINATTDHALKQNYKDKQLYRLGVYDTKTGEIESKVEFMYNLTDFAQKTE